LENCKWILREGAGVGDTRLKALLCGCGLDIVNAQEAKLLRRDAVQA
jgi:hypothetical protein